MDSTEAEQREALLEEDAEADALRDQWPEWSVFRIAGGWGAVRNATEYALTANTLGQLAGKLDGFADLPSAQRAAPPGHRPGAA